MPTTGYSDYYPEAPGGSASGRGIECEIWDLNALGRKWRKRLRGDMPIAAYTFEVNQILISLRTMSAFRTAARVFGVRGILGRIRGKRLVGMGRSLMGQLLKQLVDRSVPIWFEAPLVELVLEEDRVVGAVVQRNGEEVRVRAEHGVILCGGGFAHDARMRAEHQEGPIGTEWTSANPGDLGGAIRAGMKAGAATALMEDAWWGPSVVTPQGPQFLLGERSLPHGFIVDASGRRFMNESESYVDAGHHMYERNRDVGAIPAYLIIDSRHRRRYPFAYAPPGLTLPSYLRSGFMVKARTLRALAERINIDPDGLERTASLFAEYSRTGVDREFNRGASAYDRVYSDPTVKPNPNLGSVEKPPFYAVKIWPGDLGTKGGLLTDEHSRALRPDGTVIDGLYAAGNSSASVMGRTYPGPGATLGPAMTFGFIAGQHASQSDPAITIHHHETPSQEITQ